MVIQSKWDSHYINEEITCSYTEIHTSILYQVANPQGIMKTRGTCCLPPIPTPTEFHPLVTLLCGISQAVLASGWNNITTATQSMHSEGSNGVKDYISKVSTPQSQGATKEGSFQLSL